MTDRLAKTGESGPNLMTEDTPQAFYKDKAGNYHRLAFRATPWWASYIGMGLMCLGAWVIGHVGGLLTAVTRMP